MGKRLVLGTKPEEDPFKERSESGFSVTSSTEIRWDHRTQKRALAWPLFTSLVAIALGFYFPILLVVPALGVIIWQQCIRGLREKFEKTSKLNSSWGFL